MRLPRILVCGAAGLLVSALFLFLLPHPFALASSVSLTQTTVADFNSGNLYHTGLTASNLGGGDGDGEVRLLTLGINPSTWQSNGNVNGLPALQGHAAVEKNGYIYVAGGQTVIGGSVFTYTAGVYSSFINPDHTLTNWTATTLLPDRRFAHGMAEVNNYLYVIGGQGSDYAKTNLVSVAPIIGNGSVGTWTTTASLPDARSDFAAVVVNKTIYVLGGQNGSSTAQTTVYYARPDPTSGAISQWYTATAPLPKAADRQTAASYNGFIYEIGGTDFAGNYYPDVYYAAPLSGGDVTAWATTDNMQTNLILGSGAAIGGQLYVSGGASNNGSSLANNIATNLINSDGSLLTQGWVNSNVLSTARQRTAAVSSDDGWLYVIEGNPGTGLNPLNTIDYGPTAVAGAAVYAPNGHYTSQALDLGADYPVQQFQWNATVPAGTSLTFQYRLGDTPDLSGVSWSAAQASLEGTEQTNTLVLGSAPTARYVQYQAQFTANTGLTLTPVLNEVQIFYSRPDTPTPTATETSAVTSTPTNTATSTPTGTLQATLTPTDTPTDTPASSPTPTCEYTNTPTATSTGTPGATSTGTPSVTTTNTPSATSTGTPTSPPAGVGPGTYEDNNPVIAYSPGSAWTRMSDGNASGGTFTKSGQTGATASLTVYGAKTFSVTTVKASGRGIANVLVDGKLVGTFDGYSASVVYNKIFGPYALPDTNAHTIAIQVSGKKNPSSSGYYVVLDNFVVRAPAMAPSSQGAFACAPTSTPTNSPTPTNTPANSPTPTNTPANSPTPTVTPTATNPPGSGQHIPDTSPLITYGGTWKQFTYNGNTDGEYKRCDNGTTCAANSYAKITFSGTQVTWETAYANTYGKAQVLMDGAVLETVDLCLLNKSTSIPVFATRTYNLLTAGTHTFKVLALGTHSTCSPYTSNYVAVDGFDVASLVTLDDKDPRAQYNGWRGVSDARANGGAYREDNSAGETLSFKFTGTSVTWVSWKGPDQGKAQVLIDGINKGTFDLYDSSVQTNQQFAFKGLTNASHSIAVQVTGTKNSSATDTNMIVDAFVVGTSTYQENNVGVSYGAWSNGTNSNAYGGSYRMNANANAEVDLAFSGTSVNWITAKGASYGRAQVYIDGADKGVVDLYSPAAQWKFVQSYGGLSSGTHTLRIVVLGTKSGGSGTWIVVDGFQVPQ